ncbi:hypothetical protein [Rhizobium leguminosarum]|uniref:hypothetical protein n=1 Tax=Rhizobium leguminosarum TaxID=384 RepID=UPI001F3B4E44|nr:hypothetical protein [Rhizobium leguminosarum]UIK20664.1 hypothetical protein LZK79_29365 [Rhizobium leguminosarum]
MWNLVRACGCALILVSCNNVPKETARADLNSVVASMGYDALVLPSTAYGPGALVTSIKGTGFQPPLKLTYLCRPDFTKNPPAIIDAAASSEVSAALNGSFKLDVSALKQLGLGAQANYIKSVQLTLSNVTVEQLAYDDLAVIRSGLGPKCLELVDEFSRKSLAYQTKQAIRADVVYSFELQKGASADVKGLVIQAITATFGGSVKADQGLTVVGKGLFYGLILTKL